MKKSIYNFLPDPATMMRLPCRHIIHQRDEEWGRLEISFEGILHKSHDFVPEEMWLEKAWQRKRLETFQSVLAGWMLEVEGKRGGESKREEKLSILTHTWRNRRARVMEIQVQRNPSHSWLARRLGNSLSTTSSSTLHLKAVKLWGRENPSLKHYWIRRKLKAIKSLLLSTGTFQQKR
jgi:hypothetical protein